MPPEEFFIGTTRAGRVLRLFYEHTSFDTFTDEAGETNHNPSETRITATLDGAPIQVDSVNWSGNTVTVRSEDLGTFTATNTDYAEDHSEALRRYLEQRPSGGWEVAVVDKRQDAAEWFYLVTITNGRLTERAEFRLSAQVMQTLARGANRPTDEQVARQIASTIRSEDWAKIQRRVETPTTLMWIAHPS